MDTAGSSISLHLSNKVHGVIHQETVILGTNLFFALEKKSNNS